VVAGLSSHEQIAISHTSCSSRARQDPQHATIARVPSDDLPHSRLLIHQRWLVALLVWVAAAFGIHSLNQLPIDAVRTSP